MLDRYQVEPSVDISPTRWMPVEWIRLSVEIREPSMPADVWSFGMTLLVSNSGNLYTSFLGRAH